jgi:uncharacterized protein DUF2750
MGAGTQLHAFYRQVAATGLVWVIRQANGSLATWRREDDVNVLPVWSSESRVKRVLKAFPAFATAHSESIALPKFRVEWESWMSRELGGLGVNWEGPRVAGPEMPANLVFSQIDAVALLQ